MTDRPIERDDRAASYALCSAIVGVIAMRILVYFLPLPYETYGDDIAQSALFTLPTQLIFFLTVPFCIYRFYGKRTVRQTLEFSSVGKFRAYYLLAIPLGLFVYLLTIGISSAWSGFLSFTGYTHASSYIDKPASFTAWMFFAEIALTAVLPAICEEFCMRGGLLTTAKRSFGVVGCVALCGIVFGLFHQNVRQVFYTSLFGALAALVTVKTKSLYPAVIMHFVNNFCSVYIDYASDYVFFGGGLYSFINSAPSGLLAFLFLLASAAVAAIVVLMLYLEDKRVIKVRRAAVKKVAAECCDMPEKAAALEKELEAGLAGYSKPLMRPAVRDIAAGAFAVVTAFCTTVFTYVWGFMY